MLLYGILIIEVKEMKEMSLRSKWHDARSNAKRRGLDMALTFEEYSALVNSPCSYGTGTANGIDRKDNSIGYESRNCLPCCYRHNLIKGGNFTHDEMLWIISSCPSAVKCGDLKRTAIREHSSGWKSLEKQGRTEEKQAGRQ